MLPASTDLFSDANLFKDAFIKAQQDNEALFNAEDAAETEDKKAEETETKEAEAA